MPNRLFNPVGVQQGKVENINYAVAVQITGLFIVALQPILRLSGKVGKVDDSVIGYIRP